MGRSDDPFQGQSWWLLLDGHYGSLLRSIKSLDGVFRSLTLCRDPAMFSKTFFLFSFFASGILSQRIVLTNDDGWAVAQIHAQNDALKAAGFDVSSLVLLRCNTQDNM